MSTHSCETCDQSMELARGLMEKLEQRDQTIEQLRKELNKLKQEKAHGEMAIHTKDVG